MKAYVGYYDNECIEMVSSGGAATLLASMFIAQGGIVLGVKWDAGFLSASYSCIETIEDVKLISGTKYIAPKFTIGVDGNNIFEFVAEKLNNNIKVLFFGVGCYVGALKNYLVRNNISSDNLFTVDILCHGPAIDVVHEKYVSYLEKRFKSKLVSLNHRYKLNGLWMPKYMMAIFENGREYIEEFDATSFGKCFHLFAKPQCTHCKYKSDKHKGDLCLGDYWGVDSIETNYSVKGTSLIIQQSDKGEKLIEMFEQANGFVFKITDYEKAISYNPMYIKSREQDANYEKFIQLIKNHSIDYALFRTYPKRIVWEKMQHFGLKVYKRIRHK